MDLDRELSLIFIVSTGRVDKNNAEFDLVPSDRPISGYLLTLSFCRLSTVQVHTVRSPESAWPEAMNTLPPFSSHLDLSINLIFCQKDNNTLAPSTEYFKDEKGGLCVSQVSQSQVAACMGACMSRVFD